MRGRVAVSICENCMLKFAVSDTKICGQTQKYLCIVKHKNRENLRKQINQ